MKQNKGFTLIELLAVIVILAIIALIATPIILNMINDAKKSARKDSAYGYLDAVEKYVSLAGSDLTTTYSSANLPTGYGTTAVSCTKGAADANNCAAFFQAVDATVKGSKAENDTVIAFDANGNIVSGTVIKLDGKSLNYNGTTVTES